MCGAALVRPLLCSHARFTLEYLPGGWIDLHVAPEPRWSVVHRNIRALHGLVTTLLDVEHTPMVPRFALAPWPDGIGWRVYVADIDIGLRIAGRVHQAALYSRPVYVRCSPLVRAQAPSLADWATRTIVVSTVTPICLRKTVTTEGKKRKYHRRGFSCSNLLSSLQWVAERVGVALDGEPAKAEIVASSTQCETVRLGGKLGPIVGFSGTIVLRANGPARWLMHVGETTGIGGRTAYGFGRIVVTDA